MTDYERIRLVVLGGAGVGKSAIIRRLLGQGFTERYRPTVEDLYSRECILGTLTLKVDLLDTAGINNNIFNLKLYQLYKLYISIKYKFYLGDLQFPAMRRLSIATAHAFLLVYATTSSPSFECVKMIFEEVREQRPDYQVCKLIFDENNMNKNRLKFILCFIITFFFLF